MRRFILISALFLFLNEIHAQNNVGIGTLTPNSNAILELNNNANPLGLLLPRQDISTFIGLGTADSGLMVFNSIDNKVYTWNGTTWVSSTSEWGVNGNDIFNLNSGNVGIGTQTPVARLTVQNTTSATSQRGSILSYSNNNSASNAIVAVGSSNGLSTGLIYSRAHLAGFGNGPLGFVDYGVWGHVPNGTWGVLASNGPDSLSPNTYAALAGTSYSGVFMEGNVGIGTLAPGSPLHISSIGNNLIRLESSSTVGSWLSINNSAGGNWFHMISTGSANGEGPGKLLFHRGAGPLSASGILMTMEHSTQFVGIGTTSPLYRLDVNSLGSVSPIVRIHNSGNNTYNDAGFNTGGIAFHSSDVIGVGSISTIAALSQNAGNYSSQLSFRTSSDGSSATQEHMRITDIGNVGIGTSNPQSKLELWQIDNATDGSSGAWMRLKNAAFGVGAISTGIVFSTYNPDGTDKAGIFFRRNQGFGIGDMIFSMNNTFDASTVNSSNTYVRMILTSDGNLGIGSTAPTERLVVGGNMYAISGDLYTSAGNGVLNCGGGIMNSLINTISDAIPTYNVVNGDEDLYIQDDLEVASQAYKPGGGSWVAISDLRMKQNVRSFDDGLEKILQINPVRYQYNAESGLDQNITHIGVIAQDVQSVIPYAVESIHKGQLVREDENGNEIIEVQGQEILSFDPSSINYLLINAVQELKAENEDLLNRIEVLEAQIKNK